MAAQTLITGLSPPVDDQWLPPQTHGKRDCQTVVAPWTGYDRVTGPWRRGHSSAATPVEVGEPGKWASRAWIPEWTEGRC